MSSIKFLFGIFDILYPCEMHISLPTEVFKEAV